MITPIYTPKSIAESADILAQRVAAAKQRLGARWLGSLDNPKRPRRLTAAVNLAIPESLRQSPEWVRVWDTSADIADVVRGRWLNAPTYYTRLADALAQSRPRPQRNLLADVLQAAPTEGCDCVNCQQRRKHQRGDLDA